MWRAKLLCDTTVDEVSEHRWLLLNDQAAFLPWFGDLLTWRDALVECARIFHDILQHFLKKHLLCQDGFMGQLCTT